MLEVICNSFSLDQAEKSKFRCPAQTVLHDSITAAKPVNSKKKTFNVKVNRRKSSLRRGFGTRKSVSRSSSRNIPITKNSRNARLHKRKPTKPALDFFCQGLAAIFIPAFKLPSCGARVERQLR